MKNQQPTREEPTPAASAAGSSTWSRGSSAGGPSARPATTISDVRGRASASSSTSSSSSRPQVDAPRGAASAKILAFPRLRASHQDADGGGSLATGSNLLKGFNVLV